MLSYIFCFLLLVIITFSLTQFVKKSDDSNSLYGLFFRFFIASTSLVSITAILFTGGQTLSLFGVVLLIVLYFRKFYSFEWNGKKRLLQDLKRLIWIVPVYALQLFFLFDFSQTNFYLHSEDIMSYGALVENFPIYNTENGFGVLNEIYPNLFSGISPYHYYEIWMSCFLHFYTGVSGSNILQFCVYPFLTFLLYLAILGTIEKIKGKQSNSDGLVALALLFIGPIALPIYETLFNDGNFFDSIVFITTGFVKQTLPYSYFGQKHLPVYLLMFLIFDCFLNNRMDGLIAFVLFAASVSFGIVPGVFIGLCCYILFFVKKGKLNNLLLFIGGAICIAIVISVFGYEESKEVSKRTFYFNSFLTELNIKGEILRVISKFVSAPLWILILFTPHLTIFLLNSKLKDLMRYQSIPIFLGFSLFGGIFFSTITHGVNSDQFMTNLIPLINVTAIIYWIKLIYTDNKPKYVNIIFVLIVMTNFYFTVRNHQEISIPNYEKDNYEFNQTITNVLEKNDDKKIAYLYSDSTAKENPPIVWYALLPLKQQRLEGGIQFLNINYPYYNYPKSSPASAYSALNQMKFFVPQDSCPNDQYFGKFQLKFLKKHKIQYLVQFRQAKLPEEIIPIVSKTYYNQDSTLNLSVLKY